MEMVLRLPTFVQVNMKAMATKETIAVVGLPNKKYNDFVVRLAEAQYRLLLIKKGLNDGSEIFVDELRHSIQGDVEIVECAKNGCWEADIIVLLGEESYERVFIERIKQVSTQKIVVGYATNDHLSETASFEATNLQQLLPNSQVVHVLKSIGAQEVFIAGDHADSNQIVSNKVSAIGYHPEIVDGFSSITHSI